MSEKLARLGVEIRAFQDRTLFERERAPIEERLAQVRRTLAREKRKRAWSGHLTLAAATFVLTAAALFFFLSRPARPLAAAYAGRPVDIGAWLGSEDESLPLSFSDGTSLTLSAPSRARLVRIDAYGAELALERGTVHASVVKRGGARWMVTAGPFQILVTGTVFDASWDAAREVLTVSMQEGSVHVSGRCVEPKSLSTGATATFFCPGAVTRRIPPNAEDSKSEAVERTSPRAASSARVRTDGPSSEEPALEWHELSREGRFKESLAAAEAEGFSSLCSTLGAERLLQLGNAARLAGNPARASEAFLALRQRFAGSASAAAAGFHLGRFAFDGGHDYASSRRWFAAYLAEQPGGRFAEEALGRLMESEHRAGDRAAAEASAARYLARFPNGAHAALARSLVGK